MTFFRRKALQNLGHCTVALFLPLHCLPCIACLALSGSLPSKVFSSCLCLRAVVFVFVCHIIFFKLSTWQGNIDFNVVMEAQVSICLPASAVSCLVLWLYLVIYGLVYLVVVSSCGSGVLRLQCSDVVLSCLRLVLGLSCGDCIVWWQYPTAQGQFCMFCSLVGAFICLSCTCLSEVILSCHVIVLFCLVIVLFCLVIVLCWVVLFCLSFIVLSCLVFACLYLCLCLSLHLCVWFVFVFVCPSWGHSTLSWWCGPTTYQCQTLETSFGR